MDKKVFYKDYRLLPWLLLLPQLVIIVIFFFWPALQALVRSFQEQDMFGLSTRWVWFENFERLWADETYLASVTNTLFFSFWVTILSLSLALVFAFFVHKITRFSTLYRTAIILPYAIAPIITGVLFAFMFAPSLGVLSRFLGYLGYDWNHFLNSSQAMWLIIIASVWKQISYNFIFFYAGLIAIPQSLIMAAAVDGAGPWRRFKDIQFPLLWPTTFFLCVMNIVYAFFDTFAIIDAITSGGPGKSTSTLVYRIYFDGFKAMDYGGSAAQSVILMIFVLLLTVVQFRFIDRKIHY